MGYHYRDESPEPAMRTFDPSNPEAREAIKVAARFIKRKNPSLRLDLADLSQEANLILLDGRMGPAPTSVSKAWLLGRLISRLQDWTRKQYNETNNFAVDYDRGDQRNPETGATEENDRIAWQADNSLDPKVLVDLGDLIEVLTPETKKEFDLLAQGYTHAEAAAELGIKQEAFTQRIRRAREVLSYAE
jgi:RNA polymerase sigma factor (sigma-70 family)